MPSSNVRTTPAYDGAEEMSIEEFKGMLLEVGPICCLIGVLFVISYGIKAYAMTTLTPADYEACNALYLLHYIETTFWFSTAGLCIYGAMGLYAYPATLGWRSFSVMGCVYFGRGFLGVISITFFGVFGWNLGLWLSDTPERFVLFYPEFYHTNFTGCAKGAVLEALSLSDVVYKTENFILMMAIILVIPCCCCGLWLLDQYDRRTLSPSTEQA